MRMKASWVQPLQGALAFLVLGIRAGRWLAVAGPPSCTDQTCARGHPGPPFAANEHQSSAPTATFRERRGYLHFPSVLPKPPERRFLVARSLLTS